MMTMYDEAYERDNCDDEVKILVISINMKMMPTKMMMMVIMMIIKHIIMTVRW